MFKTECEVQPLNSDRRDFDRKPVSDDSYDVIFHSEAQ
jgi:hypothetical protein